MVTSLYFGSDPMNKETTWDKSIVVAIGNAGTHQKK
jgi:hypothetical protein